MGTFLKAILSAVAITAVFGSPAMARYHYGHHYYHAWHGGPYTVSAPAPRRYYNRDFQDGSRG
jgi:hypothetical protein